LSTDMNKDPRWQGLARAFIDFQNGVTPLIQKALEDPKADIIELNQNVQNLSIMHEDQPKGKNESYALVIFAPEIAAGDLQSYALNCKIGIKNINTQEIEERRMFPVIF